MVHWTNYSYNSQNGKLYNEVYTFDKEWNSASQAEMKSNPQRVTGINLNNWWINKYGVDFAPYRAQGWHNDLWRRPNLLRSGGISIPNQDSSPLEYTNGSHPRRWYAGNRYVFMCGHCMNNPGLVTGNVIFYNSNGVGITYEVENFDSENPNSPTNSAFVVNPNTGTINWGDSKVIRLTTDPANDGIPEIKQKYTRNSEETRFGQIIHLTGYSVIMPCYDLSNSYGGKLGGRNKIVWSGSSGTIYFIETNDGWKYYEIGDASGPKMEDLRQLTGDDEYQDLTFSGKSYYVVEQSSVSGYTFGRNVGLDSASSGVELSVTVSNSAGSDTAVSNTLDLQIVDGVTPLISNIEGEGSDSISILNNVAGNTYYHYYNDEITNRIVYKFDVDDILSNENSIDIPISSNIYSKMQGGTIIGNGDFIFSTEEFFGFIGQTFQAEFSVYTEIGTASGTAGIFYVRGITGITGTGPSYVSPTYDSGINEGTALEIGEPGITVSHQIFIQGEIITITGDSQTLSFDLNNVISPTGSPGDSFSVITSIETPYNPSLENLTLGFSGVVS